MKIAVFTGAGISAESGIPTFRGSDGLWEGYRIEEVASPEGWLADPQKVLRFYNERRRHIRQASPHLGHTILAEWQHTHDVQIITQNIDDLHERAGSENVLHLHGEIFKSRSSKDPNLVYPCTDDIQLGDTCALGSQLRPHIVWFGEPVPMMEPAVEMVLQSDMLVVVGTSLVVYPAASLLQFADPSIPVFIVNPEPPSTHSPANHHYIQEKAGKGLAVWAQIIQDKWT
jgi:NAD-dependent deacetylase